MRHVGTQRCFMADRMCLASLRARSVAPRDKVRQRVIGTVFVIPCAQRLIVQAGESSAACLWSFTSSTFATLRSSRTIIPGIWVFASICNHPSFLVKPSNEKDVFNAQ